MALNASESPTTAQNLQPNFRPSEVAMVAAPVSAEPAEVDLGIPEPIRTASAAFRRDLPRLLTVRAGQWVAYRGDEQLAFAPTKTELYQECVRRGLDPNEFLVRSIEPELDMMTVGPTISA